jgi:hypothetical protein
LIGEAGSQDHGELLELPDPEQRWRDERDRERIRWGVSQDHGELLKLSVKWP